MKLLQKLLVSITILVAMTNTALSKDIVNDVYMIEINTYGANQSRQLLIWGFSDSIREFSTFKRDRFHTILGIGVQHYECENMFGGAPNKLQVKKRGDYWYWEYRPGILFRSKNFKETKTFFDVEVEDRDRLPSDKRDFRRYLIPEMI